MLEKNEEIRIGVFLCHCGSNIAGYLDMEELERFSKTLPNVVFVQRNLYTCSEGGINQIKEGIKKHNLNRVVVASCTPRTHEPLFRSACAEAGLNPYLFEMVNIRDQCSWVHMQQKEDATEKAKALIKMGVAKAALLEPKEPISSEINRKALVIGGGIAGMNAAYSIAKMGFEVILVEKRDRLGGMLNELNKIAPEMKDAKAVLNEMEQKIKEMSNIKVFLNSELIDVKGFIGKYKVTIRTGQETKDFEVGVLIVATGAEVFVPEEMYGYDGNKVITQLELERLLKSGLDESIKNVVMIQCVGARTEKRTYCSRICCQIAVKNAILIKEANAQAKVYILYRDMQMYGVENEELLREAKRKGVRFVNYDPSRPPAVEDGSVKVYSPLLGEEMKINADLVVLSTPLIPAEDAEKLSKLLRVPLNENGFFLEAHVKLRPLDFATDGIFLCGSARFPANIKEAVSQALGAASRASIVLLRDSITVEPIVSVLVNEDACRGCGLCVALCPYGALEIRQTDKGRKVHVIEVACKGCGVCASTCYQHALTINSFRDDQILAQINAFLES